MHCTTHTVQLITRLHVKHSQPSLFFYVTNRLKLSEYLLGKTFQSSILFLYRLVILLLCILLSNILHRIAFRETKIRQSIFERACGDVNHMKVREEHSNVRNIEPIGL